MAFFKPKKTRLQILLILPLSLLLFQFLFWNQEENPLFKTVVFLSVTAQSAHHKVSAAVSETVKKYVFLLKTREENRDLKQKTAALQARQALMEELRAENARLRSLMDFSLRKNMDLLPAEVVAYDFFSRLITLNRGAADGVRKRMGVIHPKGAVGHIFRVASHSSQALVLTSKLSSLPGRVQRNRLRGLAEPGGRNLLMFKYFDFQDDPAASFSPLAEAAAPAEAAERRPARLKNAAAGTKSAPLPQSSGGKVLKGDKIVTDASKNFPSGLPVGEAVSVKKTADGGFRVFVRPSAPLSSLKEALIVLSF